MVLASLGSGCQVLQWPWTIGVALILTLIRFIATKDVDEEGVFVGEDDVEEDGDVVEDHDIVFPP